MGTLWSWSSSADPEPELFVGAAPTLDTGGTYGQRYLWPSTTAQAYARKDLAISGNCAIRFIYALASPSSVSNMVLSGNDTGTTSQFRVDISGAGLLRLRSTSAGGNTQVAQGTNALTYGAEYRFEVIRTGTTVTVKAYLVSSNALVDTISGTVGGGALTSVSFGNNTPVTGTLGAFSFDEMVVTDTTTEIGPPPSALSATVTVTPPTVGQGGTITLVINAQGGSGTYSYAVTNWGDNTSSAPQSSNTFTKSIAAGAALGAKTIAWSVTG